MAKRRRGQTGFAVSLRRHWFDDEKRIQIPRKSRVENRTVRTHAFGQNRFGEGPMGYITHYYFLPFFFSPSNRTCFSTFIVSNVMISDEPSKPNNVEVVDWDVDHADLKWTKPDSDNGAPITGYIIEYKVTFMILIFFFKTPFKWRTRTYFDRCRKSSEKTGWGEKWSTATLLRGRSTVWKKVLSTSSG